MVYPQLGPAAPKYLISSCQVQTHSEMCVGVKDNPRIHVYKASQDLRTGSGEGMSSSLRGKEWVPKISGLLP